MTLKELKNNKAVNTLISAIILATIGLVLLHGFTTNNVEGTCYERTDTCHGIPFSDNCIGIETSERNFETQEECSQIENIKENCEQAAQPLIEQNPEIEEEWMEHASYEGITCKTWNNQYNIDFDT